MTVFNAAGASVAPRLRGLPARPAAVLPCQPAATMIPQGRFVAQGVIRVSAFEDSVLTQLLKITHELRELREEVHKLQAHQAEGFAGLVNPPQDIAPDVEPNYVKNSGF